VCRGRLTFPPTGSELASRSRRPANTRCGKFGLTAAIFMPYFRKGMGPPMHAVGSGRRMAATSFSLVRAGYRYGIFGPYANRARFLAGDSQRPYNLRRDPRLSGISLLAPTARKCMRMQANAGPNAPPHRVL